MYMSASISLLHTIDIHIYIFFFLFFPPRSGEQHAKKKSPVSEPGLALDLTEWQRVKFT